MKNNSINLWRIVFTITIFFLHTGFSNGWYIGVDFFFVVSGVLLGYKLFKENIQQSTIEYAKSRFLRLYPVYAISLALYIIVTLICSFEGFNVSTLFRYIWDFRRQFILLNQMGTAPAFILNSPSWYVPCLFWVSIILYFVLGKLNDKVKLIVCCVLVLLSYGFIFIKVGDLDAWQMFRGINIVSHNDLVSDGIIRAFGGIALGNIIFQIYGLTKDKITDGLLKLCNLMEVVGFVVVIIGSYYYNHSRVDFVFLMIISVCIYLSLLPHKRNWMNNKPALFVGSCTYAFYLIHFSVVVFIATLYVPLEKWTVWTGVVCFVVVVTISFLIQVCNKSFRGIFCKKGKVKNEL